MIRETKEGENIR